MARNVSLQKRHFEYLANTLLDLRSTLSPADHAKVVDHFIYRLKATNYQFKSDRFREWALGIPRHVVKAKRKRAEPKFKGPVIATDPYWE